jgi:tetratricopeptide (TPR) repeat protein
MLGVHFLKWTPVLGREKGWLSLSAATAAALLFSLHPLRVESVAWAAERRDVLSLFFALLSTLFYLRTHDPIRSPTSRVSWNYLLSFCFFLGALVSKTIAVPLPFVFALIEIERWIRSPSSERQVSRTHFLKSLWGLSPFIFVALAMGILTLKFLVAQGLADDIEKISLSTRVAQSLAANLEYLRITFFPFRLNHFDLLRRTYSFADVSVCVSLFLYLLITAKTLLLIRKFPFLFVTWASYLLLIGPLLGIGQSGYQFTANRYTYFAHVPLCLLGGGALRYLWVGCTSPSHRLIAILLTIVFGGMSYLTHQEIQFYRDTESLWRRVAQIDPQNDIAWINLAEDLREKESWVESAEAYRQALDLKPMRADLWFNRANMLQAYRQFDEAILSYERAIQLNRYYVEALNNLGQAWVGLKDFSKALPYFLKAKEIRNAPEYDFNIATCLYQLGKIDEAIHYYHSATQHRNMEFKSPLHPRHRKDYHPQTFHQAQNLAWIQWSRILIERNEHRTAREVLRLGSKQTKDLQVVMAFSKHALAHPQLDPQDREIASSMLSSLRSQDPEVRDVIRRLNHPLESTSSTP